MNETTRPAERTTLDESSEESEERLEDFDLFQEQDLVDVAGKRSFLVPGDLVELM